MSTMIADVSLAGKARWQARSGSGHSVVIDGPAELGGENAGFRAMELMLLGLGGCLGGAMLSILHKMRQDVTDYHIHLVGQRSEEKPTVYAEVTLEHTITGRGISEDAVRKALALVEDKYCAAHAMFSQTARLNHTIRLVESG